MSVCVCVCMCAEISACVSGFGGNYARNGETGFQGLRGVTQLQSEKVLLFITSTHMSTYVLRLSDSALFPGIVISVSDPILHSYS